MLFRSPKDAQALSINYMDLDNAGITLGLFNDDGMGPYNRIDMFVPIDNLKYVTTGVSPSGLWNMDDNMVDDNIAQLSFTPMYGGVNVGQGAQEAFGLFQFAFKMTLCYNPCHGGEPWQEKHILAPMKYKKQNSCAIMPNQLVNTERLFQLFLCQSSGLTLSKPLRFWARAVALFFVIGKMFAVKTAFQKKHGVAVGIHQ